RCPPGVTFTVEVPTLTLLRLTARMERRFTSVSVHSQFASMPRSLRGFWPVLAVCFVVGCSRNDALEKKVANQHAQKISGLTADYKKRLQDQRAVVERYLGNEDSKQKYKTAPGKLGTIRAILQADV